MSTNGANESGKYELDLKGLKSEEVFREVMESVEGLEALDWEGEPTDISGIMTVTEESAGEVIDLLAFDDDDDCAPDTDPCPPLYGETDTGETIPVFDLDSDRFDED